MEDEKFVDESWKDSVEDEKENKGGLSPDAEASPGQVPEVNFMGYITSLAFQAMVFLGEIPNPITNETEKNLIQAKLLIDTLAMLREKTKNNLEQSESDTLNGFLYELQLKYVEVVNKEGVQ